MARHQKTMQTDEESLTEWGIFICYRQTDGKEAAQWLYDKLHGAALPIIPGGLPEAPRVDVYFDQTAPAVDDWTKIHQPALQQSKAFLMVCSPGAKHKEGMDDWVHKELEWWFEHRDAAPIVIDTTGEGERWIPDEIKKRWPNAQQVSVRPKVWESAPDKEREQEEKNAVARIVDGIFRSEVRVRYEDLEREKARSRQLERQRIGLAALVVIAVILGGIAWWKQIEAKNAKEDAIAARDKAQEATELTRRQLSRFLASDSERLLEEHLPLAGLLAVEAVSISHSPYTDRSLRGVLRHAKGFPLHGNEGLVDNVSLSADGQTVAVNSGGKTRVWDLTQPQAKPIVLGSGQVVALSADGETVAASNVDKTVRVWDLARPQSEPIVLSGHEKSIVSVALSADGQTVAVGSWDKAVRVWNLTQPKAEPIVLRGHKWQVNCVALSADGTTLASADREDETVWVWDLAHPATEPAVLRGPNVRISSVALSADGKIVAAGSGDKTLVWDLTQPRAAPIVLRGHKWQVNSVALSADGNTVATGGGEKTVRVWNLTHPQAEPIVLSGHEGSIVSVALSANGQTVVSGSWDKAVRVWDLNQPPVEPRVLGSGNSVALSADGQTVAVGSWDKAVRVWDLTQPHAEPVVLRGHNWQITSVALSDDGNTVASVGWDKGVRVWNLTQPQTAPIVLSGHGGNSVALSADGRTMAVNNGGNTRVWDATQPQAEPIVLGSGHRVALSADGQTVAVGSWDKGVRVWNLTQLQAAPIMLGSGGIVALSADGQTVAAGGGDMTVQVWDLTHPQAEPIVLRGHNWHIASVALSADGKTVVSADQEDMTVRVWDLTQPKAVPIVLLEHEWHITSVALSADGNTVASGSGEGKVQVWRLDVKDLIRRVCRWTGRNMTIREWRHYFTDAEPRATCPQWPAPK